MEEELMSLVATLEAFNFPFMGRKKENEEL